MANVRLLRLKQSFAWSGVIFLFGAVPPLVCANASDRDLSTQSIIDAHESTWAQIQSVRLNIKHESEPNQQGIFQRTGHDVWRKYGLKESFERSYEIEEGGDSLHKGWSCLWYDLDKMEEVFLLLPDPDHRNEMTPVQNFGAQCKRAPLARNCFHFQIYLYFLMRFPARVSDDFRTLRELAAESDSFDVVSNRGIDKTALVRIQATHPGNSRVPKGARLSILLDPSAGYLCREFRAEQFSPDGKKKIGEAVTKISEFIDFGGGIYFPKSSENWFEDLAGNRSGVNRFSVVSYQVNTGIEERELVPNLPENVYMNIFDEPHTPFSKANATKVALIGKGNEIRRTFFPGTNDLAEFTEAYRNAESGTVKSSPRGTGARSIYSWLGWGAFLFIIFTILMIWRLRPVGSPLRPRSKM